MKNWYESKAMWGGILAIVFSSSGIALNIDFTTGDFSGNIYQLWAQIGGALAGVMAVYGRMTAKTPIGKRK